ncbi:hypothetical protein OHB14_61865 [Streptomyces sp. NBC_01613]|uniref:hypothetical protein n=1 Tax=Streptomyces sp. NBC_01613 TaxID=2975896 RepID=UPI0038653324
MGAELMAGYVFAWAVRKARRVAGRADAEVDQALDAGMDRLHEVVSARLGQDPALQRAVEEAGEERPALTERTRRRLSDALEDVAERDRDFAQALQDALARIQTVAGGSAADGGAVGGNVFHGPTAVQTGDHNRQDNRFGA